MDKFFGECDPERENMCLYGLPDGTWAVDLPAEEVPPEIPEPALGINFARDGMDRKDWLALCAVHSDAWLMSVLFFYAARFDDAGRAELYSLVNQHPTVYEVVTGRVSRDMVHKRRQVVGVKSPPNPTYNNVHVKLPVKGYVAADSPLPAGRPMVPTDVTLALKGRQAELYWPDDKKWYLVAIQSLDLRTRRAK